MNTTLPAVVDRKPLAPLDLQQTKHAMETYQTGIHGLLDTTDWQTFKDRKTGEDRSFVKRSGWRKIATWFSLDLETTSIEIDRDKNGNPIRARVIARAIAPNGRYADGEGGCSTTEPRTFQKPEHDLPATAATRAINRAISNLVGLGAVSAEEIDETAPESEPSRTPALPYAPYASTEEEADTAALIQRQHPSIDAAALLELYKQALGVEQLPDAAHRLIKAIEWGLADGQAKVTTHQATKTERSEI